MADVSPLRRYSRHSLRGTTRPSKRGPASRALQALVSRPASAVRPVTVLFVAIPGFTAMCGGIDPTQTVGVLETSYQHVSDSVNAFDGDLNKYAGDSVMAIWNTPHPRGDAALLAVWCGLDIVARQHELNESLRRLRLPPISPGVGINSGDAFVGDLGSTHHRQYDAVGDVVNIAAHLSNASRGVVLAGEGTVRTMGGRIAVEELEPLRLSGKRDPERVFRVLFAR